MKKILTTILGFLGLLAVGASIGVNAAKTTVSMDTFTATSSDNIGGDKNVSYETAKGGGTSAPAIYSKQIRLYQNSGGKGGGTLTITVATGYKLTGAKIGSSNATSIAYTLDDSTSKSTTDSLAAGAQYTVTDISVESITFYCMGTTSSTRLNVNYLEATYETPADETKPFVTFKASASDEGNKINTENGILSSMPAEPEAPANQVFVGWKDETSGKTYTVEDLATATFTGNATVLVAQFRNKTAYTITYFNGDTPLVVEDIYTNLYEGDTITYEPKIDGFEFQGWYKEKELINLADLTLPKADTSEANLDLFAKLVKSSYVLIESIDNLVDGNYILSATYSGAEYFAGQYDGNSELKAETSKSNALKVIIESHTEGYTIAYLNNNVKTYFGVPSKDLESSETIKAGYYWNIVCNAGVFNITNKKETNRGISYRDSTGIFKAYSTVNVGTTGYEFDLKLYKGSNDESKHIAFVQSETKTSLIVKYDGSLTPTDVDFRFGGVISADAYNADAKYGVLVVAGEKTLTAGKTEFANAAEFIAANAGFKNVACDPAEVTEGYQFAWVISDMEGHYGDTLTGVMYMEYNGVLYICNAKTSSVEETVYQYVDIITDDDQLTVLENILALI